MSDKTIVSPSGLQVIEALAPQVSRYSEAMQDGFYAEIRKRHPLEFAFADPSMWTGAAPQVKSA